MNWYYISVFFAILGIFVFFLIGIAIILSVRKSQQLRVDAKTTSDERYKTITGVGVVLLALFLASFVISTIITDFWIRYIMLILGVVLFGVPAISSMALGLIRINSNKRRKASK